MKQWLTANRPDGIHVAPVDDLIVHQHSMSCTCAPTVVEIGTTCACYGPKLQVRKMFNHNPMDNRQ